MRKPIPGEEFEQKIRNPHYVENENNTATRISQEDIDTTYRNYQKKEINGSLTIDSNDSSTAGQM